MLPNELGENFVPWSERIKDDLPRWFRMILAFIGFCFNKIKMIFVVLYYYFAGIDYECIILDIMTLIQYFWIIFKKYFMKLVMFYRKMAKYRMYKDEKPRV